jgi:hypothetical protein
MRRTTMLWEVFVRRFEEAFEQYEKHRLSSEEAGELLGMSGWNFRRLCVRYEEDGVELVADAGHRRRLACPLMTRLAEPYGSVALDVWHLVAEPGPRMYDLAIQLRKLRSPSQQLARLAGVTDKHGEGHRRGAETRNAEHVVEMAMRQQEPVEPPKADPLRSNWRCVPSPQSTRMR